MKIWSSLLISQIYGETYPTPDCESTANGQRCVDKATQDVQDCLEYLCNGQQPGSSCHQACARQWSETIDNCPCYKDCPGGCKECEDNLFCTIAIVSCDDKNVIDDKSACKNHAFDEYGRCRGTCSDDACYKKCLDEYSEAEQWCPCSGKCPDGYCKCADCDDCYGCKVDPNKPNPPEDMLPHVLSVLHPQHGYIYDTVKGTERHVNFASSMYNVDFEGSCAALLGDRMLFLGGDGFSALNIVELTDECRTDKVGVLAYEDPNWGGLVPVYHSHGACKTWGHGLERGIWFCFSQKSRGCDQCEDAKSPNRECYKLTQEYGQPFKAERQPSSAYRHKNIDLVEYKNQLYAFGSFEKNDIRSESLAMYDGGWIEVYGEQPSQWNNGFGYYAAFTYDDHIYLLGGVDFYNTLLNSVWRAGKNFAGPPPHKMEFTELPNLNCPRYKHGVIQLNKYSSDFFITGGVKQLNNEIWTVKYDGSIEISAVLSSVSQKSDNSRTHLAIVDKDFCI